MRPLIFSSAQIRPTERQQIYSALRRGQVIAYPTDTLPGLGADVFKRQGVAQIFSLKGRDEQKPLSVLFSSVSRLLDDFKHLNAFQREVVSAFLPGSVTLLLPAPPDFPRVLVSKGYTGIRVVDHPRLNQIFEGYPHPITTTSINPVGQSPAMTTAQILSYFSDQIAIIIEDQVAYSLLGSTIIRLTDDNWEMVRIGVVSQNTIEAKFQKIFQNLNEKSK
jgi:L-threonylcarbamoyladenylate synthase